MHELGVHHTTIQTVKSKVCNPLLLYKLDEVITHTDRHVAGFILKFKNINNEVQTCMHKVENACVSVLLLCY